MVVVGILLTIFVNRIFFYHLCHCYYSQITIGCQLPHIDIPGAILEWFKGEPLRKVEKKCNDMLFCIGLLCSTGSDLSGNMLKRNCTKYLINYIKSQYNLGVEHWCLMFFFLFLHFIFFIYLMGCLGIVIVWPLNHHSHYWSCKKFFHWSVFTVLACTRQAVSTLSQQSPNFCIWKLLCIENYLSNILIKGQIFH